MSIIYEGEINKQEFAEHWEGVCIWDRIMAAVQQWVRTRYFEEEESDDT